MHHFDAISHVGVIVVFLELLLCLSPLNDAGQQVNKMEDGNPKTKNQTKTKILKRTEQICSSTAIIVGFKSFVVIVKPISSCKGHSSDAIIRRNKRNIVGNCTNKPLSGSCRVIIINLT
jgi:cob(I)alamin adenosyltransferase